MKKIFLLLLIALLCSCSKPVNVVVVSNAEDKGKALIINEKDTLILNGIDTLEVSGYKTYTYTLENTEGSFHVQKKDGILNLAKKDFVVLAIDYERKGINGNPYGGAFMQMSNYSIIDSSLVFRAEFLNQLQDEKKLNTIIDSILKNPDNNYVPPLFPQERFRQNLDRPDYVFGFKKIGAHNLFIEKIWDYGLGEEIPESISVSVKSDNKDYTQTREKKAVVFAEDFLMLVNIGFDDYSALDIREQLRERKNTKIVKPEEVLNK